MFQALGYEDKADILSQSDEVAQAKDTITVNVSDQSEVIHEGMHIAKVQVPDKRNPTDKATISNGVTLLDDMSFDFEESALGSSINVRSYEMASICSNMFYLIG